MDSADILKKEKRKVIIDAQTVPEVDAKISEWALKFIKELEVKHNVTVIFAAETGSRGYSTHMRDSDFDIKGFFISTREVYSSVMGGITAIREDHFKVEVNGKEYELDFEFYDFKKFLKKKVIGNLLDHMNFRFFSQKVYLNRFDAGVFAEIKANLKVPVEKFYAVVKGFFTAFSKDKKAKRQVLAKDILNSIVIGMQFLHTAYFYSFPKYNFHELVEEFEARCHELKGVSEAQIVEIRKAIDSAYVCYELKIKERKNAVEFVDETTMQYLESIVKMNPLVNDPVVKEMSERKEITELRANEILKELLVLAETKFE